MLCNDWCYGYWIPRFAPSYTDLEHIDSFSHFTTDMDTLTHLGCEHVSRF